MYDTVFVYVHMYISGSSSVLPLCWYIHWFIRGNWETEFYKINSFSQTSPNPLCHHL